MLNSIQYQEPVLGMILDKCQLIYWQRNAHKDVKLDKESHVLIYHGIMMATVDVWDVEPLTDYNPFTPAECFSLILYNRWNSPSGLLC